jgi:transcriptional regulator with XRE-family HTH domain
MNRETIAENMKRWRQARGLSQRALADKTGLTYVHIARLELAQSNPRLSTLERLAEALGVDAVDLLRGPESKRGRTRKPGRGKGAGR